MGVVIIATDFDAQSALLQVLFIGQRGFFFLSVLVSISVTLHAYCKKGLSRQFRKLLMKRHISFCILTGVCQVVQLIDFLHTSFHLDIPDWLEAFCIYYFVLASVFYSIVRLCEPVVLSMFKQSVSRVFCCGRKNNDDKTQKIKFASMGALTVSESYITDSSNFTPPLTPESKSNQKNIEDTDELTDSLNAFLTSSLNVELVYTILKGIRRLLKTPDLEAWKNGQVP